jgi:tetratricopeptide (TPR) repeat protein
LEYDALARHTPHKGARMSTSLRTSAAVFLVFFILGTGVSLAQTARSNRLPLSSDQLDSVSATGAQESFVDARFGSEQTDESKINDVYQEVVKVHLHGDYGEAADMYQSLVIPMAEKTPSNLTKNKFLFLGYRGLGNCYLAMSRFTEAEQTFQKLFEYLPVWPGLDDSGYPLNFESIGMARIGEQRWKPAEESLQKAVTIFDDQIARAANSSANSLLKQRLDKLRVSQDMALNLFAVVYFRERRYAQALTVLDRAYRQATEFGAPGDVVAQIIDDARGVSVAAGDADATAIWSRRASDVSN